MNFDALETKSSLEQSGLERKVSKIVARHIESEHELVLDRKQHIEYLQRGLKSLPQAFSSLEASRPWILYWITHSLALLEACLPDNVTQQGEKFNHLEQSSQRYVCRLIPVTSKFSSFHSDH
jgi:prenyltransferase beta subunit